MNPPAGWDDLVLSHPGATVFQSSAWAKFLSEYMGYEPFYLTVPGKMALQGFIRPRYHGRLFERPGCGWLLRTLHRISPVATWQSGPLLFSSINPAPIISDFLKSRGVRRIENAIPAIGNPMEDYLPTTTPAATLIVDLAVQNAWRSLKPSARKAIQSAERQGVTVRQLTTLDDVREYDDFFRSHNTHRPGRWYSFRNLSVMWKHLRPVNGVYFFVAEKAGEMLAGLGIWRFGTHIIEFSSRQTRYCRDSHIPAHDLIKWHIIQWGQSVGARRYDLAGVAVSPSTSKERGIRQFKEKWGGWYTPYSVYGGVVA